LEKKKLPAGRGGSATTGEEKSAPVKKQGKVTEFSPSGGKFEKKTNVSGGGNFKEIEEREGTTTTDSEGVIGRGKGVLITNHGEGGGGGKNWGGQSLFRHKEGLFLVRKNNKGHFEHS